MVKKIFVGSLLGLSVGCTGVSKVGNVNGVEFHAVHFNTFNGPNVTALVYTKEGKVVVDHVFSGSGIGPSVVSGASQVAASAVYGAAGAYLDANPTADANTTINSTSTIFPVPVGPLPMRPIGD